MATPTLADPTTPAPPSPPAAQASLQQAFNDASAAAGKGDCTTALPIFARLAADPHVRPGSLPAGTIAVRRGMCLAQDGQADAGEAQILSGLPILRKAGPSMTGDVAEGEMMLGRIALHRRDHDGAIAHFSSAMALLDEPARIQVLIDLAQVSEFDGGEVPLGYVDHALRIANAQAKPDHVTLATLHTQRGRILMNQGRNKEALAELKQALSLSGGLTSRVTLEEAAMRGDLAEASLLNGEKEQARLDLAYTGAGRIEASPFAVAASMAPPQCGPETGLSPDDSAIVEFGIDANGDVSGAQTVYTRGNYAVATAFAEAVEQWYWRPEDLSRIPPFYKALTRVELRCSNSGGQMPGIERPLRERFADWATPHLDGIDIETAKRGDSLERLAALARQREAGGDPAGAVAALTARGLLGSGAAALADFDRALALADKAAIPAEIVHAVVVFRLDASQSVRHGRRGNPDDFKAAYAMLAGDALANDTLALLTAPSAPEATERADVITILSRVADDSRLPEHHPLRQVALLRLANLAAAQGKLDDAQAYFTRTGLSEEQCSLIGVTPAMRSTGVSSRDFPLEALRYGFEGWVNLEFDINADGTTAHARPLIAYPPFVFVDAATGVARGVRYQATYRPSSTKACSARRETVRFLMPSHG